MNIGKQINRIRNEKGMPLSELARKTNTSKGNLSNIENGNTANPGISTLLNICEAMGVQISDIVEPFIFCQTCGGTGFIKITCPDCTTEEE